MRHSHTGTDSAQKMHVATEAPLATTQAIISKRIALQMSCRIGSSSRLCWPRVLTQLSLSEVRLPQRPGPRFHLVEADCITEVCLSMVPLVRCRFVSLAEVARCFSRLANPSRPLAVMASRIGTRGSAPSLVMRLAPRHLQQRPVGPLLAQYLLAPPQRRYL